MTDNNERSMTHFTSNAGRSRFGRREFLLTSTALSAAAAAGCLDNGDDDTDSSDDFTFDGGEPPTVPLVEDPPEAVYIPTHREGMVMPEPFMAGDFMVAPMLSYAHPFWIVTGDDVEAVSVDSEDDVHVMATVWDPETDTVLPAGDGLSIRIYHDGDLIDEAFAWSMLSQTMGFHFGDNVGLDGDGMYEVEIDVSPLGIETLGSFEGRFTEHGSGSFTFHYDDELRQTIIDRVEFTDESVWGEPGAIEVGHPDHGESGHDHDGHGDDEGGHDHDAIPVSQLPPPDELPGTHQGTEISGDADVPLFVVDGYVSEDPYVYVSPRTPYNRIPLVGMSLSLIHEGEDLSLEPTVEDSIGLHYGVDLPQLAAGDTVRIRFDSPPQGARHQGFETAFLDMPDVEFEVDSW